MVAVTRKREQIPQTIVENGVTLFYDEATDFYLTREQIDQLRRERCERTEDFISRFTAL